MERTDYEQQEVSVWNKNIEPPLLIQMFYDFIIDEENRIRKRNHEKKFQKRDLYKEISENINLSEDIVKRCQGIKIEGRPEKFLLGCVEAGMKHRVSAERIKEFVEVCTDSCWTYYKYKVEIENHMENKNRLLGTGIRVSECVGLDVEDVDFKNNGIKVTRKGGNEMVVYFGHEVEKALKKYLEVRKNIVPVAGHEHALFYSTQRKRIGIQAVENLVKKYAGAITTTKKITPHKLRSTYGTTLYQETGDIYLVADVLGHRDVNTTKKHYAAMDDARRRKAATAVHLREY